MAPKAPATTNRLQQKTKITEIDGMINVAWAAGLVPMIWGPPGVGKSAVVKAKAAETQFRVRDNKYLAARSAFLAKFYDQVMTGRPVHDIRLILMNPTDIKGIPVFDAKGKQALWVQTGSFPMATDELDRLEGRVEANYATLESYGFKRYANDGNGGLDFSKPDAKGRYPTLSAHDLAWFKAPEGSNMSLHEIAEIAAETLDLEHRVAQGLVQQFAVIFLDEISIAPKSVQGAALQLVLDRQVGTYYVPQGVDIICAGNRTADRVGAGVMTPALSSRMVHIHIANPVLDDWLPYASENGVAMECIGYLNFKRGHFFDYDPSQMTGSEDAPSTFASPRTWEMASKQIKNGLMKLPENQSMALLGGTVGEGVSASFHAWYGIYRKLPSPLEVLDGRMKEVDFVKIAATANDPSSADIRATSLKYAFIFLLMETLLEREALRDLAQNTRSKKKELEVFVKRFDNFCKFITNEKRDADWAFLVTLRVLKALRSENAMGLLSELRTQIPELEVLLRQGNGTGGVGIQMSGGKKS